MRGKVPGSIALVLACVAGVACADDEVEMLVGSPPMVSDDTGTPGPGKAELNIVLSGEREGSDERYEAPLLDFNFGLGERAQLKIEVPYAIDHEGAGDDEPARTRRGAGPLSVGVKYRFFERNGSAFAVYPAVAFRTPGGLRGEPTTWTLPLLYTHEWEHAALTANVGWEKPSGAAGDAFASVGVGTRLTHRDALLLELAGRDLDRRNGRAVALDVGLRHQVDERHAWLLAVGHDVARASAAPSSRFALIAYQLMLGVE